MENRYFDLIEHYRRISKHLMSQYYLTSAYNHRGTKGQLRENILTDTLQSIANDYVKLCKGEICDSTGRRSMEFDIIVSYLSTAIRLFGSATNHVVPVESVLAVIEVKSVLAKENIGTFDSNIKCLNSFDRFYKPTDLYKNTGNVTGNKEYEKFINQPIKPNKSQFGLSRIVSGIFAFESPNAKTVRGWLDEIEVEDNFGFICVLESFLAVRDVNSGNWSVSELKQDTFSAFASIFMDLIINCNEREDHVKADSNRYLLFAAKSDTK